MEIDQAYSISDDKMSGTSGDRTTESGMSIDSVPQQSDTNSSKSNDAMSGITLYSDEKMSIVSSVSDKKMSVSEVESCDISSGSNMHLEPSGVVLEHDSTESEETSDLKLIDTNSQTSLKDNRILRYITQQQALKIRDLSRENRRLRDLAYNFLCDDEYTG